MQEQYKKNNICILQEKIEIGNTHHITNCYIVYDELNNAILIDPAYDANRIFKILEENDLKLNAVFITHCHADHIGALSQILTKVSVPVYIHKCDMENINDGDTNCKEIVNVELESIDTNINFYTTENESISISNMIFEVLHTPGHTKGSIILYEKTANLLFTGDTIFENTYGRTDLKTGSHCDMENTLNFLFNKFNNIECFPGHGNKFNISDAKRKIMLIFAYKG